MVETRGCMYCTNTKRTKEHALATQLALLIPRPDSVTAEISTLRAEQPEIRASWEGASVDFVVVRDFCAACNSGFMNDIDCAVKEEFARLVIGDPVDLDGEGVARWARWIAKQFLSYQTAYPDPIAEREHYAHFAEHQSPLPGMHIYVAIGQDLPWPHLHARRPLRSRPFPDDGSAPVIAMQIWTAIYGQLVVQAIHGYGMQVPLRPASTSYLRLSPDGPENADLSSLARVDKAAVADLTKLRPLFEGSTRLSRERGF